MKQTVSQILQEARRKIAEEGWVKGIEYLPNADGRRNYCTIGAIKHTMNYQVRGYTAAIAALAGALPPRPGQDRLQHSTRLVAFNDAPGTTREDVLALFDAALTEVTK